QARTTLSARPRPRVPTASEGRRRRRAPWHEGAAANEEEISAARGSETARSRKPRSISASEGGSPLRRVARPSTRAPAPVDDGPHRAGADRAPAPPDDENRDDGGGRDRPVVFHSSRHLARLRDDERQQSSYGQVVRGKRIGRTFAALAVLGGVTALVLVGVGAGGAGAP